MFEKKIEMKRALTEWIDPQGMAEARQDLAQILAVHPNQSRRVAYLTRYLDAVDRVYKRGRLNGPNGCLARPLDCEYTSIRFGRLYCMTHRFPKFDASDQPRYICAQGMPSVLRPYLMRKWAHDIDIANCHVTLMYQLGKYYHLWPEHAGRDVSPLRLDTLQELNDQRSKFIEYVADAHFLDKDAQQYPGFRKDIIKTLILRIMYGGSYEAWIKEQGFFAPPCAKVVKLQMEMKTLRTALLNSVRFAPLVAAERQAQETRRRTKSAIERGIFSKIAQHIECIVLLSMCDYLHANGWTMHSLIYDGLTVEHRAGFELDTRAIERHVEYDTQFTVSIVEKPLYSTSRPDPTSLMKYPSTTAARRAEAANTLV